MLLHWESLHWHCLLKHSFPLTHIFPVVSPSSFTPHQNYHQPPKLNQSQQSPHSPNPTENNINRLFYNIVAIRLHSQQSPRALLSNNRPCQPHPSHQRDLYYLLTIPPSGGLSPPKDTSQYATSLSNSCLRTHSYHINNLRVDIFLAPGPILPCSCGISHPILIILPCNHFVWWSWCREEQQMSCAQYCVEIFSHSSHTSPSSCFDLLWFHCALEYLCGHCSVDCDGDEN